MKNAILISLAALMLASCKKEEPPVMPVITSPLAIDANCFFSFSMLRNHFIDSTITYAGSATLQDNGQVTIDPGQVYYDLVPLTRYVNSDDTFYNWPDITTPMEPGRTWHVPPNRLTYTVSLTDLADFPTLNIFPDTLKKATPYTFSLSSGRAIALWVDHAPYNEDSPNDVHENIDVYTNIGTLHLQQSEQDMLGDSAYIHVYGVTDTLAGTSVKFTKIAHWVKWVRVVN